MIYAKRDNCVWLDIMGEIQGNVAADNVEDACYKLLKHLMKEDVAYIPLISKCSIEIAEILKRYITVIPIEINKITRIDETFDIGVDLQDIKIYKSRKIADIAKILIELLNEYDDLKFTNYIADCVCERNLTSLSVEQLQRDEDA